MEAFNEKHKTAFQMTFRGQYAYLSKIKREDVGLINLFRARIAEKMGIPVDKLGEQEGPVTETKLGRLEYRGSMDNWSFAVFRYSREIYDPNEWMFPGSSELNGTIEGALRAGMEIYPG